MIKQVNPMSPMFIEVGKRFISVASIAYVEQVVETYGAMRQDTYLRIYFNVSKSDGSLHYVELKTPEEANQIEKVINSHLIEEQS